MLDTPNSKPDWALTRRERKRAVLKAAGLEPRPLRTIGIGVAVIAFVSAGAWVYRNQPEPVPDTSVVSQVATLPTMEIHPIDIAVIAPQTLRNALTINGGLVPYRQVQISSSTGGKVQDVNVRVGDSVAIGEVLMQIDVETLRVQLDQQKSSLEASRVQLGLAESQFGRAQSLADRGITAASALESDRSNLAVQGANLAVQEASVASAEISLRDATVTAPFAGTIAARDVEPGQIAPAGTNLFQLVDLSRMTINASVPVSSSVGVSVGQAVTFTIDGLDGRAFEGSVESISPVVTEGTRSTPIKVVVDNADGVLRGGMFATGLIVLEQIDNAVAVPPAAIREDDQGTYVLKIADGQLHRTGIETGPTWNAGTLVQVTSGLEVGDRVVAAALGDLIAGMSVRIAEVE